MALSKTAAPVRDTTVIQQFRRPALPISGAWHWLSCSQHGPIPSVIGSTYAGLNHAPSHAMPFSTVDILSLPSLTGVSPWECLYLNFTNAVQRSSSLMATSWCYPLPQRPDVARMRRNVVEVPLSMMCELFRLQTRLTQFSSQPGQFSGRALVEIGRHLQSPYASHPQH
ncbi:hypothetical protein BV22DRAFT_858285 [Leucogyrophana mollusca]|uniref:Uncharacterized protein n=1 Tax=Leucogyrophana mollusca TaxID=85980 RepID=A0ACB8B133_9AGAM|nr:hypothetical protein BV22DRAFT_858285 [Leucogyrophana mollusca]